MSLALSKGTCGRTFGMANQSGGRAILCRRRASGRHHMDKTGRKTGNQWATKAGNDKEDTYAMACILLKSIGAPGRNRTHGPQLRRLLLYPTELLAQIKSVERVTGIEPASPAWKAGALTIVLHLRLPSVEIVSLDILPWTSPSVKRKPAIFF